MDQEVFVPMQTVLALLAGALSLALTGHRSGLAVAIAYASGAVVWLILLAAYLVRSRGRRRAAGEDRAKGDGRAVLSGVLGLVVPLGFAVAATLVRDFHGLAFDSLAATFAAVCVCVGFVTILVSSMVDWHLILPFVHGLFGPAAWEDDVWLTAKRRRRYGKLWVAHRITCETVVFVALALVLSIVFVAVGNAVSSDKTLPVAIESLGGSGIAFALLTFLGPRIRDSVNYIQGQNAGLGAWAVGVDNHGRRIQGLVVDVSTHPGVQLRTADGARRHVALAHAGELQDVDGWPAGADPAWREQMIRERSVEVDDDDRRPRRSSAE